MRALLLATALLLALAHSAQAGLLDSPAPSIAGAPGTVVYRMGPIYFEPGKVDTLIRCTNVGDQPVSLTIEVFDKTDQVMGSASRNGLAPGAEAAFGTFLDPSHPEQVAISPLIPLAHGKARVSANATKLSCIGHQILRSDDGSMREMSLELVKKVAY